MTFGSKLTNSRGRPPIDTRLLTIAILIGIKRNGKSVISCEEVAGM